MKNLKIDVAKMLADVATLSAKERGEYISEILRQARSEQDVTYGWIADQISLSKTRSAAGAKGGASKKQSTKPKRQVKPKLEKKMYAPEVYLLETEYTTLETTHGKSIADKCVQILAEYKAYKKSKGEVVDYKSDYAAINRWVLEKAIKQEDAKRYEQSKTVRLESRQSAEEFTSMEF